MQESEHTELYRQWSGDLFMLKIKGCTGTACCRPIWRLMTWMLLEKVDVGPPDE